MYGYSDADWATTDIDERRTCIGYCVFLAGAAVFWLFEGGLGALTEAAKTATSVRELLSSIPLSWFQHNQHLPTTILIDATATKQTTDNPKHFSRAKHMETFMAWVRHVIQEGFIRTQTIPRDDNVADFMVKAQVKSAHRASTRKHMGPFQKLNIQLTGGESLKRRIDKCSE